MNDIMISAGENGSIRAAFSRTIDDVTIVTTRAYNKAGEQVAVWIERFNKAGERIY